jgi:hypothetical protein
MPQSTPISDDQVERLVSALRGHWSDFGWLMESVGVDSIAELTQSQYISAIAKLQRRRREQGQAASSSEFGT